MAGTKRVINIGTNADDGTGDLLRAAFEKINLNFDDVWTYDAVNSNLNITADSIAGTTDVIMNPADSGAFKVTGDTIINPDNGNYNFTINTDLASNVLYVKGSNGFVGIKNNAPTVALDVTGDITSSGTMTAGSFVVGNTTLGASASNTITFNAKSSTDFLPVSTTQNLGGGTNRWGALNVVNVDASGSISGTFTGVMTSTMTADINNTDTTSVNITATGATNVQNLNVAGNLVVQGTTTTLETTDVLVQNQLTFEGATADDFETTLTVTDPTQDNTITFKNATGTVAFTSDIPTNINGLSDVDTSTTPPTNGQALVWNNSNLEWEPGTVGGASEINDLTAAVTWANIPDANVPASAVTQHQAALSITESQISDLGTYLTSVPAQSFASLTGKPTTIAGYGITDAFDGDYNSLSSQPTIPSAYANSDVDAHLNQSNPTSGYVLSWNGSDYAWVANETITLATLKSTVAASTDFADFQTRIAAL